MGCITSNNNFISENPNRFEVIFADTEQTIYYNATIDLTSGNEIILYRKNKPTIRWPLASLRRYGYDAVFFTFECGRRCETGEGVFSFKCQRADVLFNTLQTLINGRAYHLEDTNLHDFAVPNASSRSIAQLNTLNLGGTLHTTTQGSSYIVNARPNSAMSPIGTISVQSHSTDTLNNGDYLEPNPSRNLSARLSSNLRLGSLGSEGSPASPSSPNSYSNILEITNLNPLPPQRPHGNIYQEYPLHSQKTQKVTLEVPQQEAPTLSQYNNNKTDHNMNMYMNASIIENKEKTKGLATLAKMESLEIETDIPSPESNRTPTALYMNVNVGEVKLNASEKLMSPIETTPPVLTNNLNSKMNEVKKDYTKNVNVSNIFGFSKSNCSSQEITHCYQNLNIGSETKPLVARNRYSRPEIFSKVDLPLIDSRIDRSEPCTPTQMRVNYIVLDLDQSTSLPSSNNNNNNFINNNFPMNGNNNGSESNFCETASSQMVTSISMQNASISQHLESPKKLGYATIDFDRSNALSNILSNNTMNDNDQSCRKTRHDSNVTPVLSLMKENISIGD